MTDLMLNIVKNVYNKMDIKQGDPSTLFYSFFDAYDKCGYYKDIETANKDEVCKERFYALIEYIKTLK